MMLLHLRGAAGHLASFLRQIHFNWVSFGEQYWCARRTGHGMALVLVGFVWSCELVPPVSCPPAAWQSHWPGLKSFVVKIGGDIEAEKCAAGNSVSTEIYRGGEHMVWEGERAATENGNIHESW